MPRAIKATTRIHMGASSFTITSRVADQTARVSLKDPGKSELSRLAKEVCALHDIKQTSAPLTRQQVKAKSYHQMRKFAEGHPVKVFGVEQHLSEGCKDAFPVDPKVPDFMQPALTFLDATQPRDFGKM